MKGWAEHYDRLLDAAMDCETVARLLSHEVIPQQLSDRARVECRTMRMEGNVPVWIYYSGTVVHDLTQREEFFGTAVPTSIEITEPLTAEELEYFDDWGERYGCPWPYVHGMWNAAIGERNAVKRAHPQLRALYDKMRACMIQWTAAIVREPVDDLEYIERNYVDGEPYSEIRYTREPMTHPTPAVWEPDSDSTDEMGWD